MTQAATYSDKNNPMNSLLPRNMRQQVDGLINGAPISAPLTSNAFLPDSVRLPSETEASYFNLLAINSHILPPFARQLLLGNRGIHNLHAKRSVATALQTPVTFPNYPVPPLSSNYSLPGPHEVEGTGELVYSIVEGEKVMGFNVWGEVRLCLPHLLRFVLNDVDIDEIGQAISKFRISCTKCSPRQLAALHGCNALPNEVTSCGLIRKSDAERMLKFLRSARERPTLADACHSTEKVNEGWLASEHSNSRCKESKETVLDTFIDVWHDCFGKQWGRIYPHLYISAVSPCILCRTCNKLFSPPEFVGHTHSVKESNGCCHWGFDSTNWRSYLHLDIDLVKPHEKVKRESVESNAEKHDVCIYRALKDFKVKFLKPLILPTEVKNKFYKHEMPDSDDEKRQHPSSDSQPLDCSTTGISTIPSPQNGLSALRSTLENQETVAATTSSAKLEIRLRPNLKIRRLWAPHQGRLHIPRPPKLIANCLAGPKPSNLSSGPPILLDPSCIVPKDSAPLYGRDFIPNVCLKPIATLDTEVSSGQQQISRSVPSVASNYDTESSSVKTRLSEYGLFRDAKRSGCRLSRPICRSSTLPLSGDSNLRQLSNQGLKSIGSSPATARQPSCALETPGLILPNTSNYRKRRCDSFESPRCPSVDSAPIHNLKQIKRTSSDPEFTVSQTLLREKRGRPCSWHVSHASSFSSSSSSSSGISPPRQNWFSETAVIGKHQTSRPIEGTLDSNLQDVPLQQYPCPSTNHLLHKNTPEMPMNVINNSNPQIPNLTSTWADVLERIDQFCMSVTPTEDLAKRKFELERQKLMTDLNSLQEKNFTDFSILLKDNKKLWKLVTDALPLARASPPITPNMLAPSPFGGTPRLTDVDHIIQLINLFHGFRNRISSLENFRQFVPTEPSKLHRNHETHMSEILPYKNWRSNIPEVSSNGPVSVRTNPPKDTFNDYHSPSMANPYFLLPSKRQRLMRHSYSVNNNNFSS